VLFDLMSNNSYFFADDASLNPVEDFISTSTALSVTTNYIIVFIPSVLILET